MVAAARGRTLKQWTTVLKDSLALVRYQHGRQRPLQRKPREDLLRKYLESQHLPFAELAYAEYCAIFAGGSRKIPIFCSNTFTKCDERGIVSVSVGAIPNRHN